MQLFTILFLIITVSTEAKKRRSGKLRSKITEQVNPMQGEFEFKSTDEVTNDKYNYPVPFGHIYKEGFEDPRIGGKQPIDALELDTVYVKDGAAARELMKNRPTKYQVIDFRKPSKTLYPPSYSPYEANVQGVHGIPLEPLEGNSSNSEIRRFWNIEGILARNMQEPPKYRIGDGKMPKGKIADEKPSYESKANFFAKKSYGLIAQMEESPKKHNFSTCNEFGERAKFHPNDIVNTEWVPFYIWSNEVRGRVTVSRVHHYFFPTKKFVKIFIEEYGSSMNKTIDWEQPKLMMRQGDIEFFLIAVDRSGLFDAILTENLPKNIKSNPAIKIPTQFIRIKIIDPYLAMMYCDMQYAILLAVSGTEPSTAEKCASEAGQLKLKGRGFPVRRDMFMEEMEARAKLEESLQKDQDKFITMEDQMAAERSYVKR